MLMLSGKKVILVKSLNSVFSPRQSHFKSSELNIMAVIPSI